MKQWIKFSTGVHKDRKMWKLSKDAQLVFFYLLSIAGTEDQDGVLPCLEDINLELWFLKLSQKTLKSIVDELLKAEILEVIDNGFNLINFAKWQATDKTKSEINRDYYQKTKKQKSEIQTEFRKNSEKVQTEFRLNSENSDFDCQKNSDEIQTLDIDIEKNKNKNREEIEKDKEKESEFSDVVTSEFKTEKPKKQKHRYGNFSHVLLTDDDYEKLTEKFSDVESRIQNLDDYLENNPKKSYANHYLTIIKWAQKENEQQLSRRQNYQQSKEMPKEESWIERAERIEAEMNGFEGVSLLDKLSKGDVIDL